MHRVRALRRRLPGAVHLRARRGQPDGRAGLAGRAVRVRLRDQLPPVHPLRPVRRGVPDRGDHRDEAVRVLLHPPRGRDLHEGRAPRRRPGPRPPPAVGAVAGRRGRPHERVDARDLAVGSGGLRGPGRAGRASSASASASPSAARPPCPRCRRPRTTPQKTGRRARDRGPLLRVRGARARRRDRRRRLARTRCTRRSSSS